MATLRAHPRPSADGLRWVSHEQWHVTLGYYGTVDDEVHARIAAVAAEVAASEPPPQIVLGPSTERLGRDGTLVVPAAGADELVARLDAALVGIVGPRKRPFVGHLTLARLRRNASLPTEVLGVACETSFTPTAVYLLDSETAPTGSVYEVRARAPFAG
jgi:2'-5' RNA ligase